MIGYYGTTEDECIKKGCCWKENKVTYMHMDIHVLYIVCVHIRTMSLGASSSLVLYQARAQVEFKPQAKLQAQVKPQAKA